MHCTAQMISVLAAKVALGRRLELKRSMPIRHNDLQFELPAGWVDATQVVIVGPEADGFQANVVVSREPLLASETLASFAKGQADDLTETIASYTLVREGPATFGAVTGFSREFKGSLDGQKYQFIQFYSMGHNEVFVLTVTQADGKLEAIRPAIEKLFASWQVNR